MQDNDNGDTVVVRRSKRQSSAISPVKAVDEAQITTPSKKRPQKRARFSAPALQQDTTGLTPFVGKTSLRTPKARRASTPAPPRHQEQQEIQFVPFRECLEPRTIRRIRRHGLSEEMHRYYADKKTNDELQRQIDAKNKELQTLKEELEASRHEKSIIDSAAPSSQAKIDQVEDELQELRQSFSLQDDTINLWDDEPVTNDSPEMGGKNTSFQIYEDQDDSHDADQLDAGDDVLAMGLELESARQAKQALFRSSQGSSSGTISFTDSPIRPKSVQKGVPPTPATLYHDVAKQLKAATNRAEEAELALQVMQDEIQSLGFSSDNDDSGCITTIKHHYRQMRLELERAVPGETAIVFENAKLMPEIVAKLKLMSQQLRDREVELKSMREQQRCLKGNFDHAIVAAEKANIRIKNLEEAIDKNAEEMLEVRMRAQSLEREAKEQESNNRSLITAIEKYRAEVKRLEDLVELIETEQAARLQDVRDATTAELSQQLSDMDAKAAAETRGRRAAEESAVERLRKINELESALSTARQHSESVKDQLRALEERLSTSSRHRDEEADGLHSRVASLSTALTCANAEIDKLKAHNARLTERCRIEFECRLREFDEHRDDQRRLAAKIAAQSDERKKHQVVSAKAARANWEMETEDLMLSDDVTPPTPSSLVRFSDIDIDYHPGEYVQISRDHGRHSRYSPTTPVPNSILKKPHRRRRYDSGIGMGSSSDVEENADQITTPDLSSELDMDIET